MIESNPSEIRASGKGHQWILKPVMGPVHLNILIHLGSTQSWTRGHYLPLSAMQCDIRSIAYEVCLPENYIDPESRQSNT